VHSATDTLTRSTVVQDHSYTNAMYVQLYWVIDKLKLYTGALGQSCTGVLSCRYTNTLKFYWALVTLTSCTDVLGHSYTNSLYWYTGL
jgi:hypothetical protein